MMKCLTILDLLDKYRGDGMSAATLKRRLKEYGLKRRNRCGTRCGFSPRQDQNGLFWSILIDVENWD